MGQSKGYLDVPLTPKQLASFQDVDLAKPSASDAWKAATLGVPTNLPTPNELAEQAPMIGGLVGSVAGPPGAAVGGATGALVRGLARANRGAADTPSALGAIGDVAGQALLQGGLQKGGQLLGDSLKPAGSWIMQKAVRPTATLLEDYRTTAPKIAQTLLENGINVTENGLVKLRGLIQGDNKAIRDLVAASTKEIPKADVLQRVADAVTDKMKTSAIPQKFSEQASKVADQFIDHPVYTGDTITPAVAQDMKVDAYKEIGTAFKKPGKAAALKALARGLKEEVAAAVPGVAERNASEAEKLAAGEAVGHRVSKDASADPLGILWATHDPHMFLAGLIQRQPVIRSMIARGMWNSAASAAKIAPQLLRSAVFALASTPSEDEK